jgi:hypothetical protein
VQRRAPLAFPFALCKNSCALGESRLTREQGLGQGHRILKRVLLAFALVAAWASLSPVSAGGLVTVPPGNRNATQPKIPHGSTVRTEAEKTSFDEKYAKVRDLLASDKALIAAIKKTAAEYDIDPVHMIGAIVGEHTYNVDAYDRLQTYYIQAVSYAGSRFRFGYGEEPIAQFLARPEFEKCGTFSDDSYKLWTCRENVWDKSFSGKKVGEIAFPRDRFSKIFFQPFYAGQTFGLGQESPLMALMMSDLVAKTSGLPKLDENRATDVYDAIMNPDKSLAYMAASIRHAIDDYKTIAHVDISKNPGVTATLYNIGRSAERAAALARSGGMPEENYFGWLINSKLPELRALLDAPAPSAKKTAQASH